LSGQPFGKKEAIEMLKGSPEVFKKIQKIADSQLAKT